MKDYLTLFHRKKFVKKILRKDSSEVIKIISSLFIFFYEKILHAQNTHKQTLTNKTKLRKH